MSIQSESVKNYSYFDKAYFQDGELRGTAYRDYLSGSRDSKTFREIAQAIIEVFQPRRVLDVGCATGAIVRWLNEFGCEAHGIDVSEWAVKNAQHKNVKLAAAEELPYSDDFFDVVITCHSLEHIPESVFDRALGEINRVCSAFQFHMLPMIGTSPYDGEPNEVRRGLMKDPTHQQLHSKDFWVERFMQYGCEPLETCILFRHENFPPELSSCQFALKRSKLVDGSQSLARASSRNQRIFIEVQRQAHTAPVMGVVNSGTLSYQKRMWKDTERRTDHPETIDLKSARIQLVVIAEGKAGVLRFAAGQDTPSQQFAHAAEFIFSFQPGCNFYTFSADEMKTLRGEPNFGKLNHLSLGGENEETDILFYLADERGCSLLP